ncbi:MAG TPA: hypothetical protein VGK67_13990 [Myxococcales bacterium]|jgi:hypothetical protein
MTSISALAALAFLAADPDWAASFDGPALSSYLGEGAGQHGILVAGAGAPVSGVVEASQALQAALRASDRVRLVMDASSLGDLAAAADLEIVKRSSALPVDLVLILRVFPGPPGKPPMAVGTFYDKQSAAQGAFSVEQGKPLAPRSGPAAVAGVPQVAIDAVEHARGKPDVGDSKRQAYEHSRLTFAESPESRGSKWTLPGRGSYGQTRLGGAEFYELVGRRDLAAGYRARRGAKVATTVLGITGIVSGAITMGVVGFDSLFDTEYSPPTRAKTEQRTTALIAGGVTLGAGVLLVVAGALIPEHSIDGTEARGLVDKYNQKLRKDYGLPAGEAKVGGFFAKGGGGLTLEVTL